MGFIIPIQQSPDLDSLTFNDFKKAVRDNEVEEENLFLLKSIETCCLKQK